MAYEKKPGDVILFRNKIENEKAPHWTGTAVSKSGEAFDIVLWEKESKTGMKYFSGYIKEPWVKGAQREIDPATRPAQKALFAGGGKMENPVEDDLPF